MAGFPEGRWRIFKGFNLMKKIKLNINLIFLTPLFRSPLLEGCKDGISRMLIGAPSVSGL